MADNDKRIIPYLNQVERESTLDRDRVLVSPSASISRLSVEADFTLAQADKPGDIILLQDRETTTSHSSVRNAPKETMGQTSLTDPPPQLENQELDQFEGGEKNLVALMIANMFCLLPWELPQ